MKFRNIRLMPSCLALALTSPLAADCPDTDGNDVINVNDLLAVISSWGPCNGCPGDIDGSGVVDVTDLLMVIAAWGSCA